MFKNILCIFIVYVELLQGEMIYDSDNYDGWIPITDDQALNIRIPDYPLDFNYDIPETNAEDNIYSKDEAIEIVTTKPTVMIEGHLINPKMFKNIKIENKFECNVNGVTLCQEELQNIKTEKQSSLPHQYNNPNKNVRRAKKLVESDLNNYVISTTDTSSNVIKDELTPSMQHDKTETSTLSVRKVYQVTENPEPIDAKTEEIENNKHLGYIYDTPKALNNPNTLNYVDLLSKTLSKYNIQTDDQLNNYALSKQKENKNTLTSHLTNTVRGFNSLNHLPVDPLLAVFLSNYGHYLPGIYGVEGNYKNLYGYLASNNIHNNRPFGLYKIYSDTDSSSSI